MSRFSFLLIYLFLTLLVTSCGKSVCQNQGIQIKFEGFDTTELTNIIVEQYKNNSNFSTLTGVNYSDTMDTLNQIHQSNDTIFSPPKTLSSKIDLAPGYDYRIILPFENREYKISKITYHQSSRHFSNNGSGGCTNDVSYYLDGVPYTVAGVSYNQVLPPYVYIVLNN